MHSEAGMARQGKLKHYDGSEATAMVAKMSVKACSRVFTTSSTHP